MFAASCSRKILKIHLQVSHRGERKGFCFKFFWEPENRIACLALGCDLNIFSGSYYGKKSPGEFAALAACLWSCLLVTAVLIFRLRAAYLGLLWVVETWRCAGKGVRLGNAVCPYVCQCLLFAIPYKIVPSCLSHQILFILELVRTLEEHLGLCLCSGIFSARLHSAPS